jgi:hypothetical protein
MLATGLSRKEQATEAWCGSCTNTWTFYHYRSQTGRKPHLYPT